MPRATIVGRSTASGRPWRPSTGHGAASASVSHPARRALPCLARLVPCRAGHVRRGPCPRGRRAADCRGGGSPREPHVCLLGDRSAGPPPGRPAQGAPPARTGRGHLSGRGPPGSISPGWLRPWGRRIPWPGASPTPCRCSRRRWNRRLQRNRVAYQALCRLSLGEAQLLAGRLEEAHALAERALALARAAPGTRPPGVCPAPPRRHCGAARSSGESSRPKPTTARPSPWPRNSACARSQAHCHLGLGTLYAKIGQREQARAALSTAIELYRAMDMTFWLPQAEAALAQVSG